MRVNDPTTGTTYAEPTALHKFVGWMWSKYSRKALLKIGVITAPIVGMVAARFGNTPSAQEAIGIGLSALVLGALDFVVSYVGKQMGLTNLESLQKISEESELIRPQPAVPFTPDSGHTVTRSDMLKAILQHRKDALFPAVPFTSDSGTTFTGQFIMPDGSPPTRSAMFDAILAQGKEALFPGDKFIAKPTSPAEDESALIDLRQSLAKPPVSLPTAAEQEATRAKLYGFSVEVDGEVHDFIDKFAAIQFRNDARADGKRATLLF